MIECSPPSLTAYDQWAQVSGLSGNQALFDSDANYDGVPNGVAFYFGAANAQTVTSGLIPSWQTVTIDNIEYQTVVFQRIDSAADHMATVRHSANLKDWADAEHGVDGVTITIIDDGFGTGVDKIVVNIPLNGATRRFSRILVTSP